MGNVYDRKWGMFMTESGENNAPTKKTPEDYWPAVLLSNYIIPRYEGDVKVSNCIKSAPKIDPTLNLLKNNWTIMIYYGLYLSA